MFLLGLYNFGNEIQRVCNKLGKGKFPELLELMEAGEKLPSWSSHHSGAGRTSKSTRASATPDLQTVNEEQPEDIQAAVDGSEDMQLAIEEFGLTGDLYMVIGVSCTSRSPACRY